MLIGSYKLIQSYVANPQSLPFPQPHSHPFAVRHNLLSSKESAWNFCKAAYPFVVGLELAAVQIIAVDTVQNSGSHIAGYLMKAGKPIPNTVSTGDLNRGRRTKSRLLFGSFCRSKKNVKTSPLRELSIAWKACSVGAARCACYEASRFCKPRSSSPQWRYRIGRFAAFHLLLKKQDKIRARRPCK